MGLDNHWRRLAVGICLEKSPDRILDIGCGTGDFTVNLGLMAKGSISITGLDYSTTMLEVARAKAEKVARQRGNNNA